MLRLFEWIRRENEGKMMKNIASWKIFHKWREFWENGRQEERPKKMKSERNLCVCGEKISCVVRFTWEAQEETLKPKPLNWQGGSLFTLQPVSPQISLHCCVIKKFLCRIGRLVVSGVSLILSSFAKWWKGSWPEEDSGEGMLQTLESDIFG